MRARLIVIEGETALALRAIAAAITRTLATSPSAEVTVASPSPRVTIADMVAFVAHETGLTVPQITGGSREAQIVRARDVVALVARDLLGSSNRTIGRALGDRDSGTMTVAVRRARARVGGDPAFALLQQQLAAHFGEKV